MRGAMIAVLVLVACKAREDGDVPTRIAKPAKPGAPTRPPVAPDPVTADALIHTAQTLAKGFDLSRITVEYVGPDGLLDPRYSKGSIGFTEGREEPDDDPDRPTGAPVARSSPSSRPKCPTWSWEPGIWVQVETRCKAQRIEAVRCPITVIWQRAIDDGAPRDALAKLTLIGTSWRATAGLRWNLEIRDTVRGVSFMRSYADDCGPIAEAPDPTVPTDRPLPPGIDRKMISNTLGTVKPKIRACHTARSRARVVVAVSVTPDGKATATVKEATTPELGACVAALVTALPFPRTRGGGTFSYPVSF
jgi:hypothetical protein